MIATPLPLAYTAYYIPKLFSFYTCPQYVAFTTSGSSCQLYENIYLVCIKSTTRASQSRLGVLSLPLSLHGTNGEREELRVCALGMLPQRAFNLLCKSVLYDTRLRVAGKHTNFFTFLLFIFSTLYHVHYFCGTVHVLVTAHTPYLSTQLKNKYHIKISTAKGERRRVSKQHSQHQE